MSFAKVHSGQVYLLSGRIVDVEVDLSRGLHAFSVIGLPDKAVEESRDRISAAIKNSGFESPKHKNQKVVISLAPAHLRKEGSIFDLPMALGYLLAAGDIAFDPSDKIFIGELSLDGELRGAAGILPIVIEARQRGFKEIFLPMSYVGEASLVDGVSVFGAQTLTEVIAHLNTENGVQENGIQKKIGLTERQKPTAKKLECVRGAEANHTDHTDSADQINLAEIKGQELAKRGLSIAAAGGHNVIMYGPPGTGKTMLAKAFRTLLPKLTPEQVLEVTSIHSIAGSLSGTIITEPPFRSPHHTSSHTALVGGGSIPRPGEITLAHRGVLFLDEFPEFGRHVIDTLRQPLEERAITISRAKASVQFPANVILIATMNPCPCGHFGSAVRRCSCTPVDISKYRKKISGPVADRIDLWIEVGAIEYDKLKTSESAPLETKIKNEIQKQREKIKRAREIQSERFKKVGERAGVSARETNTNYQTNSDIAGKDLPKYAPLSGQAENVLMNAAKSLGLSMRAYHRVWKLARTIADLDEKENIEEAHMLEALQYRPPKEPGED